MISLYAIFTFLSLSSLLILSYLKNFFFSSHHICLLASMTPFPCPDASSLCLSDLLSLHTSSGTKCILQVLKLCVMWKFHKGSSLFFQRKKFNNSCITGNNIPETITSAENKKSLKCVFSAPWTCLLR